MIAPLKAVLAIAISFLVFFPTSVATAQHFSEPFQDFDSRNLSRDDKRFLQAALAFEGHYNGLLDGDWGPISRRAFESYSRAEFGQAPADWHMAMLALSLFQRWTEDGWEMRYIDGLDMTFLFPQKAFITDPASERFINFRHTRSSLSYSVGILDSRTTQNIHGYTAGFHELAEAPYMVRRRSLAITTGTKRNGSMLYTRSNLRGGIWSTVMLSVDREDVPILNAVAASMSSGRTAPLRFTTGGRLEDAIDRALATKEPRGEAPTTEASADPKPRRTYSESRKSSSGTGFVVSSDGHILTNAHVIEGCRSIRVNDEEAIVFAVSEMFDLAVLHAPSQEGNSFAVFSPSPARLNSDVTVAGYPLAGLLSGLNVTRGAVSSLKGLAGDALTMQIAAPVQSGNSGGPVLGEDGDIVGVVVSKLNVVKAAELTGDMAQNVNFAIRGEIAKVFLAQHGIEPVLSFSDEKREAVNLAEMASSFTTFITCN